MDVASNPAMVALAAVLQDVARVKKVSGATIKVRHVKARLWNDSCLGVSRPHEICADVHTPGFVIDIEGGLRYHTDENGSIRRVRKPVADTEIRLRFERDGGLAPGHVEFKADSDTLPVEAEAELRQLIEDTDFFNVISGVPGNAPDAYTYTIWIALGRRSHVVMFSDGDELPGPKLEPLLEWLTARLPERKRGSVVESSVL
jgi:hypothetical protein